MEKLEALKRLKQEYEDIIKNPIANIPIIIGYDEDDILTWKITLLGPKDTPYKGGLFFLKILFPEDYPCGSPDIIFLTPIYHLDVNPRKSRFPEDEKLGHVSVTITRWWKPETTAREMLTQLFAVFYWQNPECPYGLERNAEYQENRPLFEEKIKFFTKKYANPLKESKFWDKDWDFTFDESCTISANKQNNKEEISHESKNNDIKENKKIELIFNDNGKNEKKLECQMNDLIRDVIQKGMNELGISIKIDSNDILFIFKSQKLSLNDSVGKNGLENNSTITIIHDVIYG